MSQPALSLIGLEPVALPDVQAEAPAIPMLVDEAGIADLRYPVTIQLGDGSSHATVANASIAASVPAHVRGVHMSRFVESLHTWHRRLGVAALPGFLTDLSERCEGGAVTARLEFPLFLERSAPVSDRGAYVAYDCSLEGHLIANEISCTLTTRVPITSLCPCSREISDYGAHNQRGAIEAMIGFALPTEEPIDFHEVIDHAENAGSAPIYSLLKRTDERYVTMQAYENPAFVEDIARAVAAKLKSDARVRTGSVRVVNQESIHAHNAYAAIKWTR
jgi:GTP cyclohydrolase FolE2